MSTIPSSPIAISATPASAAGKVAAKPSPEGEKLSGAAQHFEAIFVRQMLAEARKTHFGEDIFGGQGLDTFRQMQDERFADIAAERGSFGIGKMIEAQLSRQTGANSGERASTSSARAELGSKTMPAQPEPVEGRAPTPTVGAESL